MAGPAPDAGHGARTGTATDCVLVNGSSAAKANAAHTHAATDIVSGTLDNARTSGTASATASTLVLRDGSGGASFAYVAANNQWAYLDSHFQSFECGAYQTVGGPFENMAKYSEDFTVATWDKNGGSCSVTANAVAAPDGNSTADTITAVTATPVIQQQVAGLASGGQYTFYAWAKVASGTNQVSIAIVDNGYATYLAGPTSIMLTTAWQRFKIPGRTMQRRRTTPSPSPKRETLVRLRCNDATRLARSVILVAVTFHATDLGGLDVERQNRQDLRRPGSSVSVRNDPI
jgi:hypothetical protein